MKYTAHEIFSPQRDPSHTVITPDENLAKRTVQLLQRFDTLLELRNAYAARAEKGQRRLGFIERFIARQTTGKSVKTADVVDWKDIDRAWRAHAVAGLVVAKLYALHHAAPGERAQPKNQTDREPRLHELWREQVARPRSYVAASRQLYEWSLYGVIKNSPALAKFKPDISYQGSRLPAAFPFKPSLPE